MITVKCPNCFGQIQLDEKVEKYFCMYCRKEIREKPKTRQEIELEIKLDAARAAERLYNRNQKTFGDVMKAYDAAKPFGERVSEYWLARARFFTRGSLNELSTIELSVGRRSSRYKVQLSDREKIINQYMELMDNGIRYDVDNKEILEIEKNKTVDEIHVTFDAEHKRKGEGDRKDQQLSMQIERLHMKMLIKNLMIAIVPGLVIWGIIWIIVFLSGGSLFEAMLAGLVAGGYVSFMIFLLITGMSNK